MVKALLPLSLPLRRTKNAAKKVKKGGRLFGLDRQVGLGVEACYEHFFNHGAFDGFEAVKLRGGALQYLENDEWCSASAVDVVLSEEVKDFLEERVQFMHGRLAQVLGEGCGQGRIGL